MKRATSAAAAGLVCAAVALGLAAGTAPAPAADGDAPGGAPVLAAAGDIACAPYDRQFRGGRGINGHCRQRATSRLLRGADVVMPLGDTQDEHASLKNLLRVYDATWGRHLERTKAVIGNHEYGPPRSPNLGAAGYWRYFGPERAGRRGRGWHSFDVGSWHVVALNSLCRSSRRPRLMQRKVGCSPRSRQVRWLKRDLRRNRGRCVLAAWHHPRFSSGRPTARNWRETAHFWRVLDRAGADAVLSGHHHTYERLAKQNANGDRAPRGMRQFIVGTGGVNLARPLRPVHRASQKRVRAFGVLKLRLRPRSYAWRFVDIGGRTRDRGASRC